MYTTASRLILAGESARLRSGSCPLWSYLLASDVSLPPKAYRLMYNGLDQRIRSIEWLLCLPIKILPHATDFNINKRLIKVLYKFRLASIIFMSVPCWRNLKK